jgi:Cd2+/Zn2+-exporting ATPase
MVAKQKRSADDRRGGALVVAYGIGKLAPDVATHAFTAAMLVGLLPIVQRAIMAARAGPPFSIETLMTTAAVGAVVINAAEEAAAVVFLFLVGELLEGVAAGVRHHLGVRNRMQ